MYYSNLIAGCVAAYKPLDYLAMLDQGVAYAVHTWVYATGRVAIPKPMPQEVWDRDSIEIKAKSTQLFKSRFNQLSYND